MEAPVATLVVAGVLLLASAVQITASATTSSATVTTTTPTPAARPSATGLEFCDVPQPLHLVAGSQKSSTRLRLSPPLPQRPCRLEVTAPASNDLRLELVPVVPVVEADAAPDAQEIPDENDDAYDRHRLALYEFRDALAARDRKEDDSRAAHRRGAAITNPGMEAVSLVRQDAERRGSTANASCNLALYVQGEVAWAVDLCDPKAIADANHPDSAFAKMPGPLTLVWTPPRPGLALRAAALSITAVRKEVPADNACTVGAVKLAGRGLESAMALELLDRRAPEDRAEPCRVTVEAPSSYLLSLLLVKVAAEADSSSSYYSSSAVSNESDGDLVEDEENAATEDAAAATTRPACGLKVILGCSTELWTVDLCDPAEAAALNTTELFPNNVTLVWTSPTQTVQRGSQRTPQAAPQFATTVILTAIGRGATCKSSQFSSCWRRPRFPLCVSRELVCDGYHNCPMVGDDEDPNMCNPRHRLIETPGQEKEAGAERIIPDAKDLLYELLQSTQFNKFHPSNSSRGHDATLQGEASPDTLSNYGPWGYLMLGMLVCGAFLMLCGLWECCCRQPKPAPSAPSHTPTTVLMPQMGVSGGVLVLDSDLDDDPSRPPSYDDLDQPPAYGALFPPGQPKLDDDPVAAGLVLAAEAEEGPTPAPTSLMADAPFPEVDADDVPSLHSSPSSSSVTSTSSLAS